MRTRISFIIITTFLFGNLQAQLSQQEIDSLHQLLTKAKEDTTRAYLMNQIADSYRLSNPDSTYKYGNDALVLSRKINYRKGEAEALRNLGTSSAFLGDFSNGLEYSLDAMKKGEALGDKLLMGRCVNATGLVYAFRGDVQTAMEYFFKAKAIDEELHSDKQLSGVLINIGYTYSNMDRLDSSRIYFGEALEMALRLKDNAKVALIYLNLGLVNSKMKQYDIALAYLKQTIPVFKTESLQSFQYSTYYSISQIFDSTGHYDSAFYYSKLALNSAYMSKSPQNLIEGATQLSSLFKEVGNVDSAFAYQQMAITARDSLTSEEKEKKIQLLTFNEQLRQMDIAEQKRKDAEARKRNLQLAGIAIFVPSFFFLVLLLAKRKVKSRTIEFLGVLSLLFLFEFIALFIHPYISHWTNESQVWMLLILVAIAIVLVPLHHRLEKWMKEKLATKPKEKLQTEIVRSEDSMT